MEILLRKCGTASVQFVTPDKYKGFLKGIVESCHNKKSSKEVATTDIDTGHVSTSTNRYDIFVQLTCFTFQSCHNKKSSKEVATTDIDTGHVSTSTNRTEDKKRKRFGKPHEKNGLMEHREIKRVKKHIPNNHRTNELRTYGGDGFKGTYKGRQSAGVKSNKDPSERSGKTNKEKYSKGPASGFKRKVDSTNTRKDAAASPIPRTSSKSFKHTKVGRKQSIVLPGFPQHRIAPVTSPMSFLFTWKKCGNVASCAPPRARVLQGLAFVLLMLLEKPEANTFVLWKLMPFLGLGMV